MWGTVVGPGEMSVNRTNNNPRPHGVYVVVWEDRIQNKYIIF